MISDDTLPERHDYDFGERVWMLLQGIAFSTRAPEYICCMNVYYLSLDHKMKFFKESKQSVEMYNESVRDNQPDGPGGNS
jgi:hypothetical protein